MRPRACASDAQSRKIIGPDDEGRAVRANYGDAGWHLAIHLDDYLTDEALEDIEQLEKEKRPMKFLEGLSKFFDHEFPGCMALIPTNRRDEFMDGVLKAIEEGRCPVDYNVLSLLEDEE